MALRIDLGSIGAVLHPGEHPFVDHAVELERLGYSTIWLTGGPLSGLSQIADVVGATPTARVATGIIAVDRFSSEDVARLYIELEREHPDRFVRVSGVPTAPSPPGARPARRPWRTAGVPSELQADGIQRR